MEKYIQVPQSSKKQVLARLESLQAEMHNFIEETMKASPNIEYQDARIMYLLLKIAELKEDTLTLFRL